MKTAYEFDATGCLTGPYGKERHRGSCGSFLPRLGGPVFGLLPKSGWVRLNALRARDALRMVDEQHAVELRAVSDAEQQLARTGHGSPR